MTIPFLDFFKKKAAKAKPAAHAPGAPGAVAKPSSERLSKTVLPNATRTIPAQDPFQTQASSGSAPRPYVLGTSSDAPRPGDLPPAVALAIEPKVERVIALELGEVVNQIPAGWIRPVSEAEASRRVLLKAAEIEKGMASGRPSVSVGSIYRQIPEIFVRPVPDSDSTQVQLPFAKVLEQFKNLQLRGDQYRDHSVPQFETPFLKVTLEDNSKFGTTMGPVQTGDLPPVRVQPATAETISAAEPEAASLGRVTPTPLPVAAKTNGSSASVPPPTEKQAPAAPTRIPFKLSPTGPDAPASERVPASSGPSVPTGSPPPAPMRIPFKMTAPSEDLRPKAEPWLTKENFEGQAGAAPAEAPAALPKGTKGEAAKADLKISLPLKPVLQSLPPFQLTGDIALVPENACFELPFSLVEPQLASGRVSVKPDEFAAALPEKYKALFSSKEIAAPVALPLQDVLKNLPAVSLRMRDDQVEQEKGEDFATPFSAKAEEDAMRFNIGRATVAKPLKGTAAPKARQPSDPTATKPSGEVSASDTKSATELAASMPPVELALEKTSPSSSRSALQTALDTDDEVDAKAAVAHVGRMAGVKACAIMFGDGLSLAGNLPEVYEADGLCAMAPSLLQRIENHMAETKLGALRAMTLSCAQAAVTFFMHDNLCLAALHAKDELAADVRERLARAVHELSKKYSHPV